MLQMVARFCCATFLSALFHTRFPTMRQDVAGYLMNICNLWSLPSFSNLNDWLKKNVLQKPKVYPDTSIFDGLVMITISMGARMFFFWNMSSTWTISSHPARSIELAQTEGLTLLMAPQIFVKHKKRFENVLEEKNPTESAIRGRAHIT